MAIKIKNSTIIDDSRNLVDVGISTITSLSIGSTEVISSSRQLKNIDSLDATTTATIESAIANAPNTFTDLNVTGISTLNVVSANSLNVVGVITAGGFDGGPLSGSSGSFTQIDVSGIGTIATLDTNNGTIDFLSGTNINASGIVTANTFSGNLENTLTLNTSGTGLSGSTTFNNSGAATFTVTSNATSNNTGGTIVARDGSGNFSAGIITATRFVSTQTTGTAPFTVSSTTKVTNLNADLLDGYNTASTNTASTVVIRDGSGNFSAGTITASLSGNVDATTVDTDDLNIGTQSVSNTTTTNLSTLSATTIESFAIATYRSARVQVQITQGTDYQTSDVLIIHDGSTASVIEYASIATDDYLGTFTGAVSGGNCLLQINMSSSSSATVKVLSQLITV